jgi:hypothetical protein
MKGRERKRMVNMTLNLSQLGSHLPANHSCDTTGFMMYTNFLTIFYSLALQYHPLHSSRAITPPHPQFTHSIQKCVKMCSESGSFRLVPAQLSELIRKFFVKLLEILKGFCKRKFSPSTTAGPNTFLQYLFCCKL